MDVKGNVWDEELNNYRKRMGEELVAKRGSESENSTALESTEDRDSISMPSSGYPVDFQRYLPLLQLLETHQEQLVVDFSCEKNMS